MRFSFIKYKTVQQAVFKSFLNMWNSTIFAICLVSLFLQLFLLFHIEWLQTKAYSHNCWHMVSGYTDVSHDKVGNKANISSLWYLLWFFLKCCGWIQCSWKWGTQSCLNPLGLGKHDASFYMKFSQRTSVLTSSNSHHSGP